MVLSCCCLQASNILVDRQGHILLADLGVASMQQRSVSSRLSGAAALEQALQSQASSRLTRCARAVSCKRAAQMALGRFGRRMHFSADCMSLCELLSYCCTPLQVSPALQDTAASSSELRQPCKVGADLQEANSAPPGSEPEQRSSAPAAEPAAASAPASSSPSPALEPRVRLCPAPRPRLLAQAFAS